MKKTILLSLVFIATLFLCSCALPKADVNIIVDTEATIINLLVTKGNEKVEEFKNLSIAKGQNFSFSLPKGSYLLYVKINFDPATSGYTKPEPGPVYGKGKYLRHSISCESGDIVDVKLSQFGKEWYTLYF